MITLLIIIAALCGLFVIMLAVLAAILLLLLHRSHLPAELACCPAYYDDAGFWEGAA